MPKNIVKINIIVILFFLAIVSGITEATAGKVGDYIYYHAVYHKEEPNKIILCRINLKTGQKEKVYDGEIGDLNILGEWLYFCPKNEYNDESPICRMKLDGNQYKKLNNDKCEFVRVVGNNIYYVNRADGNKIYRMNLDGSHKKTLNEENCWSINVINNNIYFATKKSIQRMSLDGKKRISILNENNVSLMMVDNGWIFYVKGDASEIYKVKADGTGKICLTKEKTSNFNIYKGKIYFDILNKENSFIYCIDPDGKNFRKIAKGSVGDIVDNWIYEFETYQEWPTPMRISIDGKVKEVLYYETKTTSTIYYPKFSYTNYQSERVAISIIFKDDFKLIEEGKVGTIKYVKIPIALVDLNHDGTNEVIAGLQHPYYTGVNANTTLSLFQYQNGELVYVNTFATTNININKDESQSNIGIGDNSETWKNIIVNKESYRWNGSKYFKE